jgi:hypothetical protein
MSISFFSASEFAAVSLWLGEQKLRYKVNILERYNYKYLYGFRPQLPGVYIL